MALLEIVGGGAADAAGTGTDLFYRIGERLFASAAPAMVALGWSVFPQEADGRRPGRVFGQTIRVSEEHDLKNRLPSAAAMETWCRHCPGLNVACVFGPGSGDAFALDIDVTDAAMSAEVAALADRILGRTPFRRLGRAPKIALIYRQPRGGGGRIGSLSRHFARVDEAGGALRGEHGIEVLADGKMLTFHGVHHATGRYFKWLHPEGNPLLAGPEAAPEVDAERMRAFLEAVDARWGFHRGVSFASDSAAWRWEEAPGVGGGSGLRVPALAGAGGGTAWVEDESGRVSDGREQYLSALAYRTLAGNQGRFERAREEGTLDAFRRETAAAVVERFEATAVATGRWAGGNLRREAFDKVGRLIAKAAEGRLRVTPSRPAPAAGSFVSPPARAGEGEGAAVPADPPGGTCAWSGGILRPNRPGFGGRSPLRGTLLPPEAGAEDLAIPADRGPIEEGIGRGIEAALRAFFADVYGAAEGVGGERRARVHVLKAPTGAGKTTRTIRFIAEDPRTYAEHEWTDPETGERRLARAPVVMLLPTYNNIGELRQRAEVLNLDGSLPDGELRERAQALGLIPADALEGRIDELRRDALGLGLVTTTYSGKIRAGCLVADKVRLAMEAGMGTSVFCEATRREADGTRVQERCEHHAGCPALAQRAAIAGAHIVFMPHAFMALALPEELKCARAVVADERVHHLFLHSATFPASSLCIPRRPPRLSARERERGDSPSDLLAERDEAARVALGALRAGLCPAAALIDHARPGAGPDAPPVGPLYVESALRVCGGALQRDGQLLPSTPIEEVREMCSRPTGRDVREEWRFWSVVKDRIERLRADRLRDAAVRSLRAELAGFQGEHDPARRERLERRLEALLARPDRASGARDARLQLLLEAPGGGEGAEAIRVSWRTAPNWAGVPTLLLDASAAPPVVAKIWDLPEREIVVHEIVRDVGRSLNVRVVGVVNQTFSNRSLAGSPGDGPAERAAAARDLAKVRLALSAVAGSHGGGRVVAGASILLRRLINDGWAGPDNVDWCHYGAMRGLDGFKHHSAAFSVGRMEVPVRAIDGLVAALAFDDPVPEAPFDALGTGADPADPGQPLRLPQAEQRIRLRSGHVALVPVPSFPGRWARLMQRQYREEELLQFVGRLRPVYRRGPAPVWFALSSVIPEDLVVDELVHIDDLLHGPVHLWDAARRAGGVLDAEVLAAACPDLFATAEKAEGAMRALGFDPGAGGPAAPARGHACLEWRPPGGEARRAFARGADPAARLERALLEHLGLEASVRLLAAPPPTLAQARPPDAVEEAIGDRAARRAKAEARLDEAGEMLLDAPGEVDTAFGVRRYALPADLAGERRLSLPEIEALFAIRDRQRAAAAPPPAADPAPRAASEYLLYERPGGEGEGFSARPAA